MLLKNATASSSVAPSASGTAMTWWNCWPLLANVIVLSPAFSPLTSNLYSDGWMLPVVAGRGAVEATSFTLNWPSIPFW